MSEMTPQNPSKLMKIRGERDCGEVFAFRQRRRSHENTRDISSKMQCRGKLVAHPNDDSVIYKRPTSTKHIVSLTSDAPVSGKAVAEYRDEKCFKAVNSGLFPSPDNHSVTMNLGKCHIQVTGNIVCGQFSTRRTNGGTAINGAKYLFTLADEIPKPPFPITMPILRFNYTADTYENIYTGDILHDGTINITSTGTFEVSQHFGLFGSFCYIGETPPPPQ
jgi:hypothetical protein